MMRSAERNALTFAVTARLERVEVVGLDVIEGGVAADDRAAPASLGEDTLAPPGCGPPVAPLRVELLIGGAVT